MTDEFSSGDHAGVTDDQALRALRALAHPLRLQLLSLLTGQASSAAEAARVVGATQANVSYHLRVLQAAGLLEVVERQAVRGGLAVRYRHVPQRARTTDRADPDDVGAFVGALCAELERRVTDRDKALPGVFSDAELWVAPREWEAFLEVLRSGSLRLHSAARPAGSPGTVRTSTTVAAFRMRRA